MISFEKRKSKKVNQQIKKSEKMKSLKKIRIAVKSFTRAYTKYKSLLRKNNNITKLLNTVRAKILVEKKH